MPLSATPFLIQKDPGPILKHCWRSGRVLTFTFPCSPVSSYYSFVKPVLSGCCGFSAMLTSRKCSMTNSPSVRKRDLGLSLNPSITAPQVLDFDFSNEALHPQKYSYDSVPLKHDQAACDSRRRRRLSTVCPLARRNPGSWEFIPGKDTVLTAPSEMES